MSNVINTEISKTPSSDHPYYFNLRKIANNDEKKLKQNLKQKEINQNKKGRITFGERLYYKSLALSEIKKKKEKEIKEQKDKHFSQEYNFKPAINQSSIKRFNTFSNNTSNRYKSSTKLNTITTEQLKELTDIEEFNKYKKDKKPYHEIIKLTERLHNEQKIKLFKKKNLAEKVLEEKCPFTPEINEKVDKPSVENFFFRLQTWINSLNNKIDAINNTEPTDYKTGQVLFTPCTYSNYPKRENTFNFLYNQGLSLKAKKNLQEQKNIEKIYSLVNSKKINSNSEAIIESKRTNVIITLYNLLKDNNDETIKYSEEAYQKIEKSFSPKLVKIFNLLFDELKTSKESLNKDQFYLGMNHLFSLMDYNSKKELENFTKKTEKNNLNK